MSEDLSGFANTDDTEIDLKAIKKAVQPLLWRVLICPIQPRKLTKGGIALPSSVQDGEEHLNYIGRVVSLGPLAGDKWPEKWAVKEGDWVTYGRYAGQRMEWKGIKLLAVNDDEILGVIEGPEGFRVYAA